MFKSPGAWIHVRRDGMHYSVLMNWYPEGAVSCGLDCPKDISEKDFMEYYQAGSVKLITKDEGNHMGCQSKCIRRGDDKCQW